MIIAFGLEKETIDAFSLKAFTQKAKIQLKALEQLKSMKIQLAQSKESKIKAFEKLSVDRWNPATGTKMETGFRDPIKVDHPKKKKSPWNFETPVYDQRSSCFVNAGSDYGVGHRQPVGKKEARSMDEVIPKGKVNTMTTQYSGKENIPYVNDKK